MRDLHEMGLRERFPNFTKYFLGNKGFHVKVGTTLLTGGKVSLEETFYRPNLAFH